MIENNEHIKMQMTIVSIGRQVRVLDLNKFIERLNKAEAAGAKIADQELVERGKKQLIAMRELAESMLEVQVKFDAVFDASLKTRTLEKIQDEHKGIPDSKP